METNFNKPNPKKILGYLMAFAMVFFTTSYAVAQTAIDITVGGGSYDSEITWDLTDASGAMIASGAAGSTSATVNLNDCYDMNMYDSYGDGWNGASYSITDVATGDVYGTGTLASGSTGTDNVCMTPPATCTDNEVDFNMYDTWGDGWNGGTYTLTDASGATVATGGLTAGAAGTDALCLATGCYDLVVGGGGYDSEIAWDMTDATGAVISMGVAGTTNYISVGGATCGPPPAVLGCTDVNAGNYDPAATQDDGSCCYDYSVSCDGGSYQSEVGWSILDASGNVVASGGAPYYGTLCLADDCYTVDMTDSWGDGWNGNVLTVSTANGTFVSDGLGSGASGSFSFCTPPSGCTDATANNYDPVATVDDGSCQYACTAAPYAENFDAGIGTWTNNGWTLDALGTPSFSTGPSDDITGGGNYMFYETSGAAPATISMTSECLDISALAAPALSFYNHMYGATIGTLDVLVNGTNVWSMSGDQGDQWNWAQVDLSAFAGTDIVIEFVGTKGTSYTGDMAIDEVSVNEFVTIDGCTDPNALNYDPTANNDDGSCTYCTDNYVSVTCDGGSFQGEVSWTLSNLAGAVIATGGAPYSAMLCLPDDCYTLTMVDSYGDGWNGNTFTMTLAGATIGSATLATGSSGSADFSVGVTCPVLGCTDANAVNYDPNANTDDGSCQYACTAAPYCENFDLGVGTWTNNGWINDANGTTSGNTGPTDDITGGGFYMYYETSTGYAPTVDMTSECLDISSLSAPALSFYNHMYGATIGTLDVYVNGTLEWTMSGDQGNQWNWVQVDLSAYAGTDVTIMIEASYGGSFTGDIAIDEVCVGEYVVIAGCTDPIALNYDPAANTDDGSCTYCQGTMMTLNMFDSFGDGWNGATFTATGNSTGTVYGPYTIATGAAATEMICMDDDCYTISVGGGTWDSEITWNIVDPSGNIVASGDAPYLNQGGLGVGITCPVYGCTDPTALNYDTLATADDGSCAYLCDIYVASAVVDAVPSCNGASDASATAIIDGSFGDDYYLWSDGQTTSTATGLSAGTYTCTITDSVNGCTSTATVVIDPTPSISISAFVADATPGNTNGSVDLTVSGGTPCYNGAAMSLAGTPNTTTQWASNVFDVTATSDLQITSIDQPSMAGVGTADVYYRLGSGQGYEMDPTGWILAGSAPMMANVIGDMSNIPVQISVDAGETICIYVQGIGVNCVFGSGADSTYNAVVSSDANLAIISGFATGGSPGSGTTYPSASSYDFGGNINYSLSSYTYAWSNGATTEDVSGLGLGPISVTVTDCNGCTSSWSGFVLTNFVYGCTDTLASNYDASANTDDGSCLYDGCTDSLANNYDAGANNDDGTCTYSCSYYGWDDELTITFTPDWYTSENSWYIINVLTGDTALASQPYANGGAVDVQTLCANAGCFYIDGYDTWGDGWGGGTLDVVDQGGNTLTSFSLSFGTYESSAIFSVAGANCALGCTDSSYINYDANAVIDDGSCTDTIIGCTDPAASNYTPFSNVDDGSCCYDNTVSITVGGGSFLSEVSWDIVDAAGNIVLSGGAPYAGDACLLDECYTVNMYDSWGDGWNGSTFEATSGGVVIGSGGLTSGSSGSFTFAVGSGSCAVYGCTDPAADNYDATATDDDGTCCYDNSMVVTTGIDYFGTPYNWSFNGQDWSMTLLGDSVPALIGSTIYGGTFTGDDATGCLPDGCYEFAANDASGWIGAYCWFDINGTTYSGTANGGSVTFPVSMLIPVGSATCPVLGCTDSTSVDYDPAATQDDGSCTYPCLDNLVDMNMYDSWGDGWNGAIYTITDVATGTVVATDGLTTGSFQMGTLCLPDGCYNITVGGGAYDSEITFDFAGLIGQPVGSYDVYIGTGACPILGCTDSTAVNYDPAATQDDGSCILACTVAPHCENFDAGVPADWVNNGWTIDANGTTSSSTGPSDDITGGGNYMYFETSYPVVAGDQVTLSTLCLDVSALSSPALSFYNHMYGASMGTLEVLVNGAVVWSMSGDQGNQWNWAQVDLSAYAGNTNITIDFIGTAAATATGTVFWGDMAIDEVCVDEYLVIAGCTDPAALNYDPTANSDDGSCNYCADTYLALTVGGGSWASEVGWTLTNSAGTVIATGGAPYSGNLCLADDCYTLSMTDAFGDGWNGNTWALDNGMSFGLTSGSSGSADFAIGAGTCPVYGCTDSAAVNYDPAADTDDGSCDYLGCTNPTATNYDANATIDDGSCVFGCTLDEVTLNLYDAYGDGWGCYDGSQSIITIDGVDYTLDGVNDNGSSASFTNICIDLSVCNTATFTAANCWSSECSWDIVDATGAVIATGGDNSGDFGNCPVYGCTDPTADNYDPSANTDDGSCTYTIYGCTDPTACNYDANANTDDGTCSYAAQYYDCAGNCINDSDGDGICDELEIPGCTDATAQNYDANATDDDGSCTYCVFGCTDNTQYNYDPNATCDDGSCEPFTYGCTDPAADNYNSTVNTDDGSCYYLGCTDPAADNYDANATIDDGTCTYTVVDGCTDPAADNYDPNATNDDGSCTYPAGCSEPAITGLFVTDIIDDRATANFDNMNTYDASGNQVCRVDQIRIKYRPVGTSSWSQKNLGSPTGYDPVTGICNSTQKTDKIIYGLTLGTTYEWEVKVWYCSGGNGGWTTGPNFTTAPECPNIANLTAYSSNAAGTRATFDWDDSNGSYEFARIKMRVDSISNPSSTDWFLVGGSGVPYGTFTKNKNGLVPGETYRAQARTWCNPNGGPYNSLGWTSLVTWTQDNPGSKLEGGSAINNLDVYPNPSRDVFNVTFTSDDVQDLEVKVINVVGEVVYTEDLTQFVGEYTKVIDLATYTKGVYFLEITTNNGVVNKKLILQ